MANGDNEQSGTSDDRSSRRKRRTTRSLFSYVELEAQWEASDHGPTGEGQVALLVTRGTAEAGRDKIHDPRHETPERVRFTVEDGFEGDRWKPGKGDGQQVSLTSLAVAKLVAGAPERWHLIGSNLIVNLNLSEEALPTGSRLAVGSGEIEISDEPYTPCNRFEGRLGTSAHDWVADEQYKARHLRGRYARVVKSGEVGIGDIIRVLPS